MSRYYHVMKKEGQWHLYAGNAISALMVDMHRANIVRAARTLARHNGAKVILHRDNSDSIYAGALRPADSHSELTPADSH